MSCDSIGCGYCLDCRDPRKATTPDACPTCPDPRCVDYDLCAKKGLVVRHVSLDAAPDNPADPEK